MASEIEIAWSPEALEQLQSIFEYVADRDLEAAKRLVKRLEELADGIAVTPEIGRMVPEYGRHDLRERIYKKSYRLIYRLRADEAEIASPVGEIASPLARLVPVSSKMSHPGPATTAKPPVLPTLAQRP